MATGSRTSDEADANGNSNSADNSRCGISYAAIRPHLTPWNILLALIFLTIIVSGAILFMALVGMITFPSADIRAAWVEVNSQILNALFTFTALASQPERFMLAVWTYKYARAHFYGIAERDGSGCCGGSGGGDNDDEEDTATAASTAHKYASLIQSKIEAINLEGLRQSGSNSNSTAAAASPAVAAHGSLENTSLPETAKPAVPAAKTDNTANAVDEADTVNNSTTIPSPTHVDAIQCETRLDMMPLTHPSPSSVSSPKSVPFWQWIVILVLLNGQCIFQYPITAAMWAWAADYNNRPPWIVGTFLPLSFLSGAIGGIAPMLMARKAKKEKGATNATTE